MIHSSLPHAWKCSKQEFEQIKKHIAELELDNRELHKEEFLTISTKNAVIGFGRIRSFGNFSELCSLGVIASERLKGIGKQIVLDLIEKSQGTLYLVCVIPGFFERLGFYICDEFPLEIHEKLNYCTRELPTNEAYVVMRRK